MKEVLGMYLPEREGAFTSKNPLQKLVYLATKNIEKEMNFPITKPEIDRSAVNR